MLNTVVMFTGNVVRDPELRQTTAGRVTSITVAATERRRDPASQTYADGVTTYYKVTCWKTLGDRVAETLRKGDPVIVCGRLTMQTFEKRDGTTGYSLDVNADALGPDLRLAKLEIRRPERREDAGMSVPAQSTAPSTEGSAVAATADPWGAEAQREEPAA
jgi:single-strand DNA-binding protein